jgi:multidrug efflux system outer membrane protein
VRSAFILAILALCGCAAPEYRSPAVPIPASFGAVSDSLRSRSYVTAVPSTNARPVGDPAVGSSDYWDRLGDTTLSRLIGEVSHGNLDVRAARARLDAARSSRLRTALDLAPSTTVSASYVRQRYSSATFPGAAGVFPDQNVWDAGVTAAWDLDVFGQIRQTLQAQGALVGAATEDLRDVQVTLTAALATAYFELRGAQEQLAVARQNAKNQRQSFELARERLDAGRGSAFDTERAQAQLSSTLASIPAREAQVAAVQYRIGVLIGRSPTDVAAELDRAGRLPALPDVTAIGAPALVVRDRPDVSAAERTAAAQSALVGAAKASYLPRIAIGGSAGYAAPLFRTIGDQGTFRYAVGPVITWPALNLGRVKAEIGVAQAQAEAARARYNSTVLAAIQDLETALVRYRTARDRAERLEEASAASDRAADLALLRFREGVTDFLQVLDAQRTQLAAQDQLAQARTDAATAYAQLYRAAGGSP